jgi:hypothetical protein
MMSIWIELRITVLCLNYEHRKRDGTESPHAFRHGEIQLGAFR